MCLVWEEWENLSNYGGNKNSSKSKINFLLFWKSFQWNNHTIPNSSTTPTAHAINVYRDFRHNLSTWKRWLWYIRGGKPNGNNFEPSQRVLGISLSLMNPWKEVKTTIICKLYRNINMMLTLTYMINASSLDQLIMRNNENFICFGFTYLLAIN